MKGLATQSFVSDARIQMFPLLHVSMRGRYFWSCFQIPRNHKGMRVPRNSFEICEQGAMAGRTAGGSSVCCRPGLAVTAWLVAALIFFRALFVLDNFGVSIPPDRLPQMG